MPFQFACEQIACNDTPCFSIHHDDIHHFMPIVHLHGAECDLTGQGLVCAEQ